MLCCSERGCTGSVEFDLKLFCKIKLVNKPNQKKYNIGNMDTWKSVENLEQTHVNLDFTLINIFQLQMTYLSSQIQLFESQWKHIKMGNDLEQS